MSVVCSFLSKICRQFDNIQMLDFVFLHFRISKIAKIFLYSPSFFRLFKTYLIFISSLIVRFSFNRYQKSIWAWKKFCRFQVFWVYLFKFSEFIDDAPLYTLFFSNSSDKKYCCRNFSISNLIVGKLHSNGFFKTTVSIWKHVWKKTAP